MVTFSGFESQARLAQWSEFISPRSTNLSFSNSLDPFCKDNLDP